MQFGLNFWLLDVLAGLAIAHLTIGIRLISSKDWRVVAAALAASLILTAWLLYR